MKTENYSIYVTLLTLLAGALTAAAVLLPPPWPLVAAGAVGSMTLAAGLLKRRETAPVALQAVTVTDVAAVAAPLAQAVADAVRAMQPAAATAAAAAPLGPTGQPTVTASTAFVPDPGA